MQHFIAGWFEIQQHPFGKLPRRVQGLSEFFLLQLRINQNGRDCWQQGHQWFIQYLGGRWVGKFKMTPLKIKISKKKMVGSDEDFFVWQGSHFRRYSLLVFEGVVVELDGWRKIPGIREQTIKFLSLWPSTDQLHNHSWIFLPGMSAPLPSHANQYSIKNYTNLSNL